MKRLLTCCFVKRTPKQEEPVAAVAIGIDGACMLTVTDGWRQAMVGTVALYAASGERLHTIYLGATPEYGKETFIERMEKEIKDVRALFPDATYVGIADGAKDNWPFSKKHTQRQLLDFYHATEYLTEVADAVFIRNKKDRKIWFDDAYHRLKHNRTGPSALLSLRILSHTEGRWAQFWQKIDANSYSLAA